VPDLDQLVESHREPIQKFAARIQELAAENGLGWTLYGAVADGTLERNRPSIQSVLVLRTVDLEFLRRLGAVGRQYGRLGFSPPLIMTPAFLQSIRDTFPLELIEIQQTSAIVFGPDYFHDLEFDDRNVRLQCERELDVMLIGLRQGVLAASGIEDRLALLQRDWLRGLLRILRGMLWLKGQREHFPAERVVSEIERIVEASLPGIRRALTTSRSPGWEAFHQLHTDVEALGTAVDGW
jgi:hypothetical protein